MPLKLPEFSAAAVACAKPVLMCAPAAPCFPAAGLLPKPRKQLCPGAQSWEKHPWGPLTQGNWESLGNFSTLSTGLRMAGHILPRSLGDLRARLPLAGTSPTAVSLALSSLWSSLSVLHSASWDYFPQNYLQPNSCLRRCFQSNSNEGNIPMSLRLDLK